MRRQAEALRQGDAEVPQLVTADFEHGNVHNDLGSCAVEVVDQLLCENQLVRGRAQHDRILTINQIELYRRIEQIAESHQDFVGVVLLRDIGQVKGLHRQIVQVGSFVSRVLRHKDGVRGDRLPEGSAQGLHDAESIEERNAGKVDLHALGAVLGIKDHIDPRELADRLVDVL